MRIDYIERVVELTGGELWRSWRKAGLVHLKYGDKSVALDLTDDAYLHMLRNLLADAAIRTLMTTPANKLQGNDRALVVDAAGGQLL